MTFFKLKKIFQENNYSEKNFVKRRKYLQGNILHKKIPLKKLPKLNFLLKKISQKILKTANKKIFVEKKFPLKDLLKKISKKIYGGKIFHEKKFH